MTDPTPVSDKRIASAFAAVDRCSLHLSRALGQLLGPQPRKYISVSTSHRALVDSVRSGLATWSSESRNELRPLLVRAEDVFCLIEAFQGALRDAQSFDVCMDFEVESRTGKKIRVTMPMQSYEALIADVRHLIFELGQCRKGLRNG